MPRVTSKAIGKAIEKKLGIPDVILWNGGGYHYFTSDNKIVNGFLMGELQSTSHYVYRMSDLTIEEWVESFESDLSDTFLKAEWQEEALDELKSKLKQESIANDVDNFLDRVLTPVT